jgi:EmrB/QacA subfamily drug resistance transporter
VSNATAGSLADLQARYGERLRWRFLYTLMVGTVAAIMSSTIINVAVPDMSHHFDLSPSQAQWLSSSFMLAMTLSMLTTPWLLGRYGYRRTYTAALSLLMVGGVVGGLAQSLDVVLAMRVVEGLAAGVTMPIPALIIMRAFESHEQAKATSVFGVGVVLAPAIGPSIGGLLVDVWNWRAIFFMVVPFCLAAIVAARRYVPVSAPGGQSAGKSARLDLVGLALAAVFTVCLLNGAVGLRVLPVAEASALLAVALVALAAFVAWQRRVMARSTQGGIAPLVHLDIFRNRSFQLGSRVTLIYGVSLYGSTYLMPVYMQSALGLSPSLVGVVMLPAGLMLSATMGVVGRLASRFAPAHMLQAGLVGLFLAFNAMWLMHWTLSIALLVMLAVSNRIALGFTMPNMQVTALGDLDKGLMAYAASSVNFLRMLGGAVGIGLVGVLLDWRLAAAGEQASQAARMVAFHEVFSLLGLLCGVAWWLARGFPVRMRPAPPVVSSAGK